VSEPNVPNHVVLAVFCDHCEAQLVVEGCDRADAHTKLRTAITDAHWRVTDRLGDVADMATLTGKASSTTPRTPDLCDACAKVLL
jgi:hypothetical protein